MTWRVEFLLSTAGYVRLYSDNTLIGALLADTHTGGYSYWKQGIYSQPINGVCYASTTTMWIRNLQVDEGTCMHPFGKKLLCTCPSGFSGTVLGGCCQCNPCPIGTWAAAGTGNTCSTDQCISPGYAVLNDVCVCAAGYAGSVTFSVYSNLPTGCLLCGPGTYAVSGASTCSSCPPGTFSPSIGVSVCTPCTSNTYAGTAGATVCAACPEGR